MDFNKYVRISLVNFIIVASLGLVLRLKLVFAMPWINQKNMLNAHNYLAFVGWVGLMFFLFFARMMYGKKEWGNDIKRFFNFYILNSWLLFLAFTLYGYSYLAFLFISFHLILSVWFTVRWFQMSGGAVNKAAQYAVSIALTFNLLSFAGLVILLYCMITQTGSLYFKQNAIYIFLHYQYNGYFLFSCLGLFVQLGSIERADSRLIKSIAILAVATFLGLSLLLLMKSKPLGLLVLNGAVAIMIFVAIAGLWQPLMRIFNEIKAGKSKWLRLLLVLSFVAFVFKELLQALSAIPAVGYMVYEHRSIAIGYLHLVFLLIVSFFFLYMVLHELDSRRISLPGLILFIVGVVLNEIILALQGFGAIFHFLLPATYMGLVLVSMLMLVGLLMVFIRTFNYVEKPVIKKGFVE